jgi:hypothetical protein
MQYRLLSGVGLIALIAVAFAGMREPAIAEDGTKLLLLCVLLTAGFSVAYHRGRKRAFWLRFLVVLLLEADLPIRWSDRFVPLWQVAGVLADTLAPRYLGSTPQNMQPRNVLYTIVWGFMVIAAGLIGGFVASTVHANAHPTEGRGRTTGA